MTTLALVAVVGALALLLLYVYVVSRKSARLAGVKKCIQEEVSGKLRRDAKTTQAVVDSILTGMATDQVLANYETERAAILTHERTDKPWLWSSEDLEDWRKKETRSRSEEVNRKLMVPAANTALLIVGLCVTGITISYNFLSEEKTPAMGVPTEAGPPILQPLPASPSLDPAIPISVDSADQADASGVHEDPIVDMTDDYKTDFQPTQTEDESQ